MQLERLLLDVTGGETHQSQRQRHALLAEKLNAKHGDGSITTKGVAKWFERGSIPGPWMMKIAQLAEPPLNIAEYA